MNIHTHPSTRRLVTVLSVAIATVYLLLVWALPLFWETRRDQVQLLSEAALVGITMCLIIYLFWYRPLLRESAARDAAERAYQMIQKELETMLEARTAALSEATTKLKSEADERKRLAVVVEQTSDAIMVTDTSHVVEYVNSAFEASSGYMRAEVVGRDLRTLRDRRQENLFEPQLAAVLEEGHPWQGRIKGRRKDGGPCQWDASVLPLRNDAGGIVNHVVFTRVVHNPPQIISA
ncbi:MAG: PAS domain S-box protein [Verrucomicrobia bacterium]|nr:PAS domain S-box protein [Verrucomicrobiota bacterium]